ncbi:MAG: MMPL family transporter, partial [Deltaproteobacteria bacterium]|nr:MMPL family transporter [Deltaproteobacteria bacterium]
MVRHRALVVILILSLSVVLAFQTRHLHLEIRRRANLPNGHPYVQVQNRISDLFGGEAIAIVGVVANSGEIYQPQILGKLSRITQRFEKTPGVIATSLFSMAAPYVKTISNGADGSMEVRQLMSEAPQTVEAAHRIRNSVRNDPLLKGNLVSDDETASVIVVEFDDQLTDTAIASRIDGAVEPERDDSVTIALAGAPILRAWLARYTALIGILLPVAVVVIGLVHYEAFRTLQGMLLPLVTAVLSVVWALGIMGLSGYPIDTWSAITPVVILAVAAGHAVQILKRYYEE